jgi:ABC-2 type transport system ATP-binding protein
MQSFVKPGAAALRGPARSGRIVVEQQTPALRLRGLHKQFGDTVVVDGIGLDIPPGCVFGVAGPAGAGKTTLLAMAMGLLPPDAGGVGVFGVDLWADTKRARRLIGVLPGDVSLPGQVTARDWLTATGLLRGFGADRVLARVDSALDAMALTDAEATRLGDFSAGMLRRLCLAAALLPGPKLLVADEPLAGVDPSSAATIRAAFRDFTAADGAVLLSGQEADPIAEVCDRIAVLDDGKLRAAGPRGRAAARELV